MMPIMEIIISKSLEVKSDIMNYDNIMMEEVKTLDHVPSLLLHSCCAPCSSSVIERLAPFFDITVLYYNPNIEPYEEYLKRKEEQKKLLTRLPHDNKLNYIDADYDNDLYHEIVSGFESEPERGKRCYRCYQMRLEYTYKRAAEEKYEYFASTLTLSPYKVTPWVNEIGLSLAKEGKVKYLVSDFKKRDGYKRSIELSNEYGLYRQDYCGCIYSKESRYNNPNPQKPELPTGCEYESRRVICVKKIENKDEYLDLLLDADPSKASIDKYLNDSDVYGLQVDKNIVSLAVILPISKNTLELKNLVTKKEYRGNGYAKKLLKSLCGNYNQNYNKMLVGTSENNIPFYVKQGFDKYEKTIKNYFIDNYDEEIIDGDLHCIDMYYYSKDLKKAKKEM